MVLLRWAASSGKKEAIDWLREEYSFNVSMVCERELITFELLAKGCPCVNCMRFEIAHLHIMYLIYSTSLDAPLFAM